VVVHAVGFRPGPRSGPTRPGPWRPHLPHAPPLLSISFSFPAQQLPLPLFHLLCPRCDPVGGCRRSSDPKVSFLSPSSLPPSPSLSSCVRHPCPCPPAAPLHPPRSVASSGLSPPARGPRGSLSAASSGLSPPARGPRGRRRGPLPAPDVALAARLARPRACAVPSPRADLARNV
jgi:hypothetical protein